MIERIKFLILNFMFWLLYFIVFKALFLIYNAGFAENIGFVDYFGIFYHGLQLDVSISAYILFVFSFLMGIFVFIKPKFTAVFFHAFTVVLLIIFTFIHLADIGLYSFWNFRMDLTPLLYIDKSAEFTATLEFSQVITALSAFAFIFLFFYFLYRKFSLKILQNAKKVSYFHLFTFWLIAAIMIIPMRGGLGEQPIKLSSVYFHSSSYANHAAINEIWNLMYSVTKRNVEHAKVSYMSGAKAEELFKTIKSDTSATRKILKSGRPNILLIALEGISNKIIDHPGATPFLKQLRTESVYFTNFFANGDRTDKAMVALLSSYPPFTTRNIIAFPRKFEKLPYLSLKLKEAGYFNAFFYGGSLDFANYRGYLVNGGFEYFVTIDDFSKEQQNSKWGAHDGFVFQRMFKDLEKNTKKPFFAFMFTSSSHEPYEVPNHEVIKGNGRDSMSLNAANYADKSLMQFIEKAQKTDWWKNTLVLIVADHGTTYPFNTPYNTEKKFRIPLYLLGGALAESDTLIETFGSQADIAKTVLNQLHLDSQEFIFGNDLFSRKTEKHAFFTFNNGFGFFTDSSKLIHDNTAGKYIFEKNIQDSLQYLYGKAYLQILSDDFQER